MNVCAVIPAYNEAGHIAEVVAGCLRQGLSVLVVDDGSSDGTGNRAAEAGAEVLRNETNLGKGAGLARGMEWARRSSFDAAVLLDGDGQHDPSELPRFVKAAESTGAHIVLGTRMRRARGMPLARFLTNRFTSAVVSRLAGVRITDSQSGYRLVRTDVWPRLRLSTSHFDTESEMLVRAARLGQKIREVPISTIYGDQKSEIRPVRDSVRFFKMIARLWREGRRARRGPRDEGPS